MGLIPDDHLTVTDPALEAKRRSTAPGMAHFAGSGPAGRSCRECTLWTGCGVRTGYYASKGMYGGTIKPRACQKYRELMRGEIGPGVPHMTQACKYFTDNPKPPPISERRS